ncbi:hypothetical protein QWY74_01430 [Halomonas almeriensis]|uniref:hypothetical protein n=1 Tax=Halomonas almeriensis TaxID=308163 RepID=UPI0025B4611F|nr:hypothetical protein [Halomonas almeriensis]MDN3552140.1 hypothetical protein [Halomonas almeriensis]
MSIEGRRKKEEGRRKKEEGRRKKEEGRRKKEEGRRKKEEGRRKKEEGRQHEPRRHGVKVFSSLFKARSAVLPSSSGASRVLPAPSTPRNPVP